MFVLPLRDTRLSRGTFRCCRNQDFVASNPSKCLPVVSAMQGSVGRGEAMRRWVTCGQILG
jgi:hypothetical protein